MVAKPRTAAQAKMASTCGHQEALWKTVGSSHKLLCRYCSVEIERRFAGDEIPSLGILFLTDGEYLPFDPRGWLRGWLNENGQEGR